MTLRIYYGDWYDTLIQGSDASYFDSRLSARVAARARGFRFDHVEIEDGRVVEVWEPR